MTTEPDYYAVLGVPVDATDAEVRAAYRRLARQYHPDIAGDTTLDTMRAINAAYTMLGDPERRRDYDLRRGVPSHPYSASHGDRVASSHARPTTQTSHPRTSARTSTSRPSAARTSSALRRGMAWTSGGPFERSVVLEAHAVPVADLAVPTAGGLAAVGLLDGRVLLIETVTGHLKNFVSFGGGNAGVLQAVRYSPHGQLLAAWGFALGLRVWSATGGEPLWSTTLSAPSGLLDVALGDTPARATLAVPDGPLALAGEDPFEWAHAGRSATAVYTRGLAGVVTPSWMVPRRAEEEKHRLLGLDPKPQGWMIRNRLLAADGNRLLTFAVTPTGERSLGVWDLRRAGVLRHARLRRVAHASAAGTTLPLAATDNLHWIAAATPLGVALLDASLRTVAAIPTGPLMDDTRLALAPAGTHLAVAQGEMVTLYSTRTREQTQQWRFDAPVTAIRFGPGPYKQVLGIGLANGISELWIAAD